MRMPDRPPRYRAYLLRCWEERSDSSTLPPTWRFAIEQVPDGRRRGFSSLEALAGFLQEQLFETARLEEGEK